MSDSTLNRYVAEGTHSQRLAFTPSPATPASGPNPCYLWFETDTSELWAYNVSTTTWTNVSGSGSSSALTLISTQTASNSANLSWTGLSSTVPYLLRINGLVPATSNVSLLMQFGQGGGPTWATSGYNYNATLSQDGSFASGAGSAGGGTAVELCTAGLQNSAPAVQFGEMKIFNAAVMGEIYTPWPFGTGPIHWFCAGDLPSATMTAMRLLMSSGNITSGSASLYSYST